MHEFELHMKRPQDHIMANTWRLILERRSKDKTGKPMPMIDLTILEQVLPEFRFIGLCLSQRQNKRPN